MDDPRCAMAESIVRRNAVVLKIDVEDLAQGIEELWSPVEVARVNDQVVRLAKLQGEYHWHKHKNEDELFYVLKGRIVLQLRGQPDITLDQGQMAVVPKGMEHCPRSDEVSHILVFEPHALVSQGD
jgi:mannose-6-phosphate isomerase-like protein (cupin superfamily)